jgi:hypothetical protein
MVVFALMILGLGLLTTAYGARLRAIKLRKETTAKLTAEAGYEDAIGWMNERADVFGAMAAGGRGGGSSGTRTRKIKGSSSPIRFPNSSFEYTISFDRFLGSQPVYEIVSNGYCDRFSRTIKALVVQAVSGWDMGLCRIPTSNLTSGQAFFTSEDIIDIPIHVNSEGSPLDELADIYVSRRSKPRFRRQVSVEESRYTWWGGNKDKYSSLIGFFDKGIYFDQPPNKVSSRSITGDNNSVVQKVGRFRRTTLPAFRFAGGNRPIASDAVPLSWSAAPAVQLEFYVSGGGGRVQITNNCTVSRVGGFGNDWMLASGVGNLYTQYPIYAFHYAAPTTTRNFPIGATYVSQRASTPSGRVASTPAGGQIFIEGNAIIGGAVVTSPSGRTLMASNMFPSLVGGRLTVVATGNIWIVSPILYAGAQSLGVGGGQVPAASNLNVLGLFSQFGVVKVVDPGLSSSVPTTGPGVPAEFIGTGGSVLSYQPIGYQKASPSYIFNRQLPQSMTVQAAITVCGGGWGAENVGARFNTTPGSKDNLFVAGSITEAVQGIVAKSNNGFRRRYYFDDRLLGGILPGDMWLQSKYTPTPGGWSDSRL